MWFKIFDGRVFEAIAHIFVAITILINLAPEYKVIQSFANLGWVICYGIGALMEGIRIPQAVRGVFYSLMTGYYWLNSSFGTQ